MWLHAKPIRPAPLDVKRLEYRVPIVPATLGDDGEALGEAAAAADGVVLVALGAGHVSAGVLEELRTAVQRVPVLVTCRPDRPSMLFSTYGFEGAEGDIRASGAVCAPFLSPAGGADRAALLPRRRAQPHRGRRRAGAVGRELGRAGLAGSGRPADESPTMIASYRAIRPGSRSARSTARPAGRLRPAPRPAPARRAPRPRRGRRMHHLVRRLVGCPLGLLGLLLEGLCGDLGVLTSAVVADACRELPRQRHDEQQEREQPRDRPSDQVDQDEPPGLETRADSLRGVGGRQPTCVRRRIGMAVHEARAPSACHLVDEARAYASAGRHHSNRSGASASTGPGGTRSRYCR